MATDNIPTQSFSNIIYNPTFFEDSTGITLEYASQNYLARTGSNATSVCNSTLFSGDITTTSKISTSNLQVDTLLTLIGNIFCNNKTITPTILSYLSDVTSNIQTQLNTITSNTTFPYINCNGILNITVNGNNIKINNTNNNWIISAIDYLLYNSTNSLNFYGNNNTILFSFYQNGNMNITGSLTVQGIINNGSLTQNNISTFNNNVTFNNQVNYYSTIYSYETNGNNIIFDTIMAIKAVSILELKIRYDIINAATPRATFNP